ncbi:MAG TPA: hypothetical protein VN033_04820 [Vulgatibacter sp.]|nr:hypothetical protein [Vulgatibacter sp.]
MARLLTGVLLIFAGTALAAWNAPRVEARPAGIQRDRDPDPRRQVEGAPPAAEEQEVDEGKARPPGREDPNQFYKKAPRKPRQLRHIYAAAALASSRLA